MPSQVEIANIALQLLGDDRIASLDDEGEAAAVLKLGFDLVRDKELEAHPWKFATRRVALAALADAPAWGYARQFLLPADCLRVLEVNGQWVAQLFDIAPPFAIEHDDAGTVLRTDLAAPLQLRYTARVTDTVRFSPLFAYAFAAALAAYANERLTQSSVKQDRLDVAYERSLFKARRANALERPSLGQLPGFHDRARA